MRLLFDSRPGADCRGIGRYVRSLLPALRATAPPGREVAEGHRPRRDDVFHSPWIDGALLRSPCPQVVTLHDMVPLKRPSEYLRTGVRFRLRYLAASRAGRIIVPTGVVARDVEARLGVDPERITVVPEAVADTLGPRSPEAVGAVRAQYGLPEDYLLWVGGLAHPDPRKRIAALAEAPRELPLVLVGPAGEWARRLPGVTLTGEVPDDDLAAIYSGARALVFPSDDEGFGLPPVEALACGTPVVASDLPVLREVLDDRVTFVPRDDVPALVAAAERASRPAPAPPQWSWVDAARATWAVYEEAAAAGTNPGTARRRRVAPRAAAPPPDPAGTTVTGSPSRL